MSDMSADDVALFNAAHDRLQALKGSSDVQDLVARLVSGIDGFQVFVAKLFALPSVQAAMLSVSAGAAAGVGALAAGATPPPFGAITGPLAAAAAKFVGDSIAHKLAGA